MNQPLSYVGFILCLVLITICFIAAVYLSYRKSSRLRDMVQFVISPKDNLVLDFKISSIIKTALWFILIHVSITVGLTKLFLPNILVLGLKHPQGCQCHRKFSF